MAYTTEEILGSFAEAAIVWNGPQVLGRDFDKGFLIRGHKKPNPNNALWCRQNYMFNRESRKAWQREYYARTKAERAEYARGWYQRNKQKLAEKYKASKNMQKGL